MNVDNTLTDVAFGVATISLLSAIVFLVCIFAFRVEWSRGSWITKNFTYLILANLVFADFLEAFYYMLPPPLGNSECSFMAAVGVMTPISSGVWNFSIVFLLLYFGWLKAQFCHGQELLQKVVVAFLAFFCLAWILPAAYVACLGFLKLYGKVETLGRNRCWILPEIVDDTYHYVLIGLLTWNILVYVLLFWQQYNQEHPWILEFGLYLPVYFIVTGIRLIVHFVGSSNFPLQVVGALVLPLGGFLNSIAFSASPFHKFLSHRCASPDDHPHEEDSEDLKFTPENTNMSATTLFGHQLSYVTSAPINSKPQEETSLFS